MPNWLHLLAERLRRLRRRLEEVEISEGESWFILMLLSLALVLENEVGNTELELGVLWGWIGRIIASVGILVIIAAKISRE